jgi:hypothetical protein
VPFSLEQSYGSYWQIEDEFATELDESLDPHSPD